MELGRIGIWSDMGPFDNHTALMTNPHPPGWCRIDPGIGAATTRVLAASREDSCPQAILKFQPCNSCDYRACYEPQHTENILSINVQHLILPNEF